MFFFIPVSSFCLTRPVSSLRGRTSDRTEHYDCFHDDHLWTGSYRDTIVQHTIQLTLTYSSSRNRILSLSRFTSFRGQRTLISTHPHHTHTHTHYLLETNNISAGSLILHRGTAVDITWHDWIQHPHTFTCPLHLYSRISIRGLHEGQCMCSSN